MTSPENTPALTYLPFAITSDGGRFGRIEWTNTSTGRRWQWWGFIRWLHWPDDPTRCYPPSPWGAGDPQDGMYRDFASFERWDKPEAINDMSINDRIDLYIWACSIHSHGYDVGRGRIQ